ncbi:MAG TPA: hypothetical protein VMS93_03065, partial [Candidatus Saccharimonadales bacterium]|nr:hypothetical protein [Candidatus Saccharimonadales bacterium]
MSARGAGAVRAWLVLALLWLLAHALGTALPLEWLWGVGAWGLYPASVRRLLLVVGLVALGTAAAAVRGGAGPAGRAAAGGPPPAGRRRRHA